MRLAVEARLAAEAAAAAKDSAHTKQVKKLEQQVAQFFEDGGARGRRLSIKDLAVPDEAALQAEQPSVETPIDRVTPPPAATPLPRLATPQQADRTTLVAPVI